MNIKSLIIICIGGIIFSSCGSIVIRKISSIEQGIRPLKKGRKQIKKQNNKQENFYNKKVSPKLIDDIIKSAESYIGTPYKLGGTTKKGIDCSALMVNAFSQNGIKLPRVSQAQAKYGKRLKRNKDIKKGDLLFFATGSNKHKVTHVGLVYEVTKNDIMFIHASSSKGVRIDNLSNSYWNPRYLFANRLVKD